MPPRPVRPSGESCSLPSRALSQPTTTGGSVKTTERVEVKISGSGSDDAHFAYYADIPAVYHQVETREFISYPAEDIIVMLSFLLNNSKLTVCLVRIYCF